MDLERSEWKIYVWWQLLSAFFNVVSCCAANYFHFEINVCVSTKNPFSVVQQKKEKLLHTNFLAYLTFVYSKLHQEFWGYVCTVWYSHYRGKLIKFAINLSSRRFLESRRRDRLDFSQLVKYGGGSSFSRHTNPIFYLFIHLRKVDFTLSPWSSRERFTRLLNLVSDYKCLTRRGRFIRF